jgi:hypothetical protein
MVGPVAGATARAETAGRTVQQRLGGGRIVAAVEVGDG